MTVGPLLIVFGGLPGTGKTTLARAIAADCDATYLRIDTIEQALKNAGAVTGDIGPTGYIVAYALTEANLKLGGIVVTDSVNRIAVTRDAWLKVAKDAHARIVEIEVVCSDEAEHRRRVETRVLDVPGLVPPTWKDVRDREYEPWSRPRIVIDTAHKSLEDTLAELRERLDAVLDFRGANVH